MVELTIWTNRVRVRWTRPRRWMPRDWCILTIRWFGWSLDVFYKPWHGLYPYRLLRSMPDRPSSETFFPALEEIMKRKVIGGGLPPGGVQHLAPVESDVFSKLPNLVSHCCVTQYDDGEVRQPGWFTVKTLGSAWVVQVKDPDAGAQITATSDTLDNALCLADLMLGSEDAPWEPDRFLRSQGARRKKGA